MLPPRKREILHILSKAPLTNSEISKVVGITPAAVSDHMRKLVGDGLVEKTGKKFTLTPKGLITLHTSEIIESTLSAIEKDREFWEEHDLTAIPSHLLLRLGELGNYEVIKSGENEILKHKERFTEVVRKSKWIRAVFGFFLPDYPPLLTRVSQHTDISVVVSRDVAVKLEDHQDILKSFKGRLFVCDNIKLVCIAGSEGLCLGLFLKNGQYDVRRGIISHDSSAAWWGRDLHAHFIRYSYTF
ncbi:helix-turn-helix transcriptional regulator [Archaeoglobus neptunius]|uniref:helix-turn-helix transcriptional regulator n=1 Tax=Archaeoglobus neptunius TaxID=2798580 RepID=UPI001927C807|nr:winged helix-turn-helix domain-containing protein [Archaeoglobus neptunius]